MSITVSLKNIFSLSLVLGLLALLPGCWPFSSSEKKAEFAYDERFVVISVNDKDVHADCSIKGSINVALSDIESFSKKLKKDAEIVIYCTNYMCSASGLAAKQLKALGFEKVRAYEGGSAEWFQAGYPVEGSCKMPYLKQKMTHHEGAQQRDIIEVTELKRKMDEFYYTKK